MYYTRCRKKRDFSFKTFGPQLNRLGGQDPLDYISMYHNPGNAAQNIPPHWHYISFGLSDLHGDNRVHPPGPAALLDANGVPLQQQHQPSGMGFELSFRLAKSQPRPAAEGDGNNSCGNNNGAVDNSTERPPTWPANLLQSLARYVFQTGNRLCSGDNVPWGRSLDQALAVNLAAAAVESAPAAGSAGSSGGSRIQHMLIAPDAQLTRTQTPFGWVDFYQIVGVTDAELEQASRWNGIGVCNLLRKSASTGGDWLITEMRREHSVFELFPETLAQLEHDLEVEGSDLAGVNADFAVLEWRAKDFATAAELSAAIGMCKLEDDETAAPPAMAMTTSAVVKKEEPADAVDDRNDDDRSAPHPMQLSQSSLTAMSDSGSSLRQSGDTLLGSAGGQPPINRAIVRLEGVQITLAPAAARFLLMAIKDRIRHGRHFTFKCEHRALTFVAQTVSGAIVTPESPYCVMGYWTQLLIADDLVPEMVKVFAPLAGQDVPAAELPKHFEWPNHRLRIVIDAPPVFFSVR